MSCDSDLNSPSQVQHKPLLSITTSDAGDDGHVPVISISTAHDHVWRCSTAAPGYHHLPIEARNDILPTVGVPAAALNHINHASDYTYDEYYSCCGSDHDPAYLYCLTSTNDLPDDLTLLHNNIRIYPAASDQIGTDPEGLCDGRCKGLLQDDISSLLAACENDYPAEQHERNCACLDDKQLLLPAQMPANYTEYDPSSLQEVLLLPPWPQPALRGAQLNKYADSQFEGNARNAMRNIADNRILQDHAEPEGSAGRGDSSVVSEGIGHTNIMNSASLIKAAGTASAMTLNGSGGSDDDDDLEEVLDILLEQVNKIESASSLATDMVSSPFPCSPPCGLLQIMNDHDHVNDRHKINVTSAGADSCVLSQSRRASAFHESSSSIVGARSLHITSSIQSGQEIVLDSQEQDCDVTNYSDTSFWQEEKEHRARAIWLRPTPGSSTAEDPHAHDKQPQDGAHDAAVHDDDADADAPPCEQIGEVSKRIRVSWQQADDRNNLSDGSLSRTQSATLTAVDHMLVTGHQQVSSCTSKEHPASVAKLPNRSSTTSSAVRSKAAWIGPTLMDVQKALESKSYHDQLQAGAQRGAGVVISTASSTTNSNYSSNFKPPVNKRVPVDRNKNNHLAQSADSAQTDIQAAAAGAGDKLTSSFLTDEVALLCKDDLDKAHDLVDSWRARLQKRGGGAGPTYRVRVSSEEEAARDGYRWRKYGQKSIKNSPFPRCYYKCTSGKCQVKKQVERCTNESKTFLVTYEGLHDHSRPDVCHMCASSSNFTHSHCPNSTA
ncbi:hypothetical protein L7F22_006347 [Adiantum nelumboides]|nr:hypothetical protein [Adiantum nelumboides]